MPSKKKSPKRNHKRATSRTAKKSVARGKKRSVKALDKKPSRKKSSGRSSRRAKKTSVNTARELAQEVRNRRPRPARSSNQQIDFQGLSRDADADSESVDELVEEGNAFEAGAVAGVEEADKSDGREVHTHEVPEDDVPDEYLDQD